MDSNLVQGIAHLQWRSTLSALLCGLLPLAGCGSGSTNASGGPAKASPGDSVDAAPVSQPDATSSAADDDGGIADGGTITTSAFPLLGSAHGGHVWNSFCAGKDDSTPLPPDPRTLVVPGVNAGKAVNFNVYWRDCKNPSSRPSTCGELRQKIARGWVIGEGQGEVGSPTTFAGDRTDSAFAVSSSVYNDLWKVWGFSSRPAQFDELVAQRYGSAESPNPNPYPLPGEDPNQTQGGSGQLPLIFTQLRNPDGTWTGQIGMKFCASCHNGQIGTSADGPGLGTIYGGAGTIGDFEVAFHDFGSAGSPLYSLLSIPNIANQRGSGAIDQFQIGFILFGLNKPQSLANPQIVFSQSIGTIKSPAWWNMGHRPQKFWGDVLPTDSSRIDMAAYYPFQDMADGGNPTDWVDRHDTDFQTWAESQNSPQYPGPIDRNLAEQGAVLFHAKNLWEPMLNNPVPRPPTGNGSCASCHGAYSPYFVNDPGYLDSPALEGIAAYMVPSKTIATDPIYASSMQSLRNDPPGDAGAAADVDAVAPPVSANVLQNDFLYCGFGEAIRGTDPVMLAPPLYGVWASAPYFHNASVPNVWGVLKPSDRPKLWRRVSAPQPAGLEVPVVMGFDTDFQRAYDTDNLGWKYDQLQCGDPGTQPQIACVPANPDAGIAESQAAFQQSLSNAYKAIALLWNIPLPQTSISNNTDIENRKIYNTYVYSQSNVGHEFTSVLTDGERRAIIEYLKTL